MVTVCPIFMRFGSRLGLAARRVSNFSPCCLAMVAGMSPCLTVCVRAVGAATLTDFGAAAYGGSAPPAGDHTLAGTRSIIQQHAATGTQMRK